MILPRALVVIALLVGVAACDKDKEVDPPAELVDIEATVPVQSVWSTGIGGGGEKLRLALALAEQDGTIFAAARNGRVRAIDAATGRTRWQTDTKLELSAGPGVGDGLVVVVGRPVLIFAMCHTPFIPSPFMSPGLESPE